MGNDIIKVSRDYVELLKDIKERIRTAQVRAALSANREMVLLYWHIGGDILNRQAAENWGAKVIERLAADLRVEFPEMKGFSARNLKYMRAFAEAYPDAQFVQQAVAQIPWGHNVRILDYVKDHGEREWYIRKTIEQGWSRLVLVHQIENGLYHRQGKAITKAKNKVIVEYALRDTRKPTGVSGYKLTESAVVLAWLWRKRFDERFKAQTPRHLVCYLPMRALVEQAGLKNVFREICSYDILIVRRCVDGDQRKAR